MPFTDVQRQAVASLARFLLDHGRLDDAETVLRALCTVAPADPYGWYGLSVIADRRGALGPAIEHLAHCCSLSEDPRFALSYGEALLRSGARDEAAAPLERASRARDPAVRRRAIALLRRR